MYTHQAGKTPALQQNWQSSEKSQNFKEKTQYLMNTLYILPNTNKECSADSLAPKPICPGESARQGNFLLYNLYNLYNVLRVPNVLKTVCFHTLYLRQSKPSYNFPILILYFPICPYMHSKVMHILYVFIHKFILFIY